jgi:hypothetical protein
LILLESLADPGNRITGTESDQLASGDDPIALASATRAKYMFRCSSCANHPTAQTMLGITMVAGERGLVSSHLEQLLHARYHLSQLADTRIPANAPLL